MITLAIAASLAKTCAVAADFPARAVAVTTGAAAAAAAAATGTTAALAAASTEVCTVLVDADFRALDLGLAAPSYLVPAAAVAAVEAVAACVLLRRATIHMCHNLVLQCQNHLRYQTADSTPVQHCRRTPILFSPPGASMCN